MSEVPKKRGRPSKAEIAAREAAKGSPEAPEPVAQSHPLDHDHDGNPGGSLKKNPLRELEASVLVDEFFEAYEMQQEQDRFDSINRRWTFAPDIEQPGNRAVMVVQVKLGPMVKEWRLGNDKIGAEGVRGVVTQAIDTLSRSVQ